jgi:O-acetylserine/cysteine efflux transporter
VTGIMITTMPRRHVILAFVVAVVWGVNFVVIHVGLRDFPPLLFAALRFTVVAFPAVLFVRRPAVPLRWVLGVGTFLSAGQFGLLFVAMDQGLPAGLASLVLQVQVLFTIAVALGAFWSRG